MFAEFTQRASLALPESEAELTVTEPATTFGCLALEPPSMPSSTVPVVEDRVALPVPAFTVSHQQITLAADDHRTCTPPSPKRPWTGVVAASLIQTPPPGAEAVMLDAFTHSASLALPEFVAEVMVTDAAVTFGASLLAPPGGPVENRARCRAQRGTLLPASMEPTNRSP